MDWERITNVKKIAVLRANAIGDFIFVLPAIRALRETYPEAEIVYLGKPWHKSFLKSRPSDIDRVIVVPVSHGVREEIGIIEKKEEQEDFFKEIRKENFDLGVQLHGGGKNSNPFLLGIGAKFNIGTKTPDAVELDRWVPYIYYQSEILRYLEVAALVGARTAEIEPKLMATKEDRDEAIKAIEGVKDTLVVMHPGASDIRRQWPANNFAKIGDELAEKGATIVLTGVDSEKDTTDTIMRMMRQKAFNLNGKLSLGGMLGLLSLSDLVISNDTGPLHLAEAVGAKTVGIYWCGNLINAGPMTRTKHRAKIDERRKKLSCQRDLSSRIGLFCPLSPSSEVSSSKVAVFRELQNFQTVCLR
jgi:ADP-heptose:LPS heptosyltransferase